MRHVEVGPAIADDQKALKDPIGAAYRHRKATLNA